MRAAQSDFEPADRCVQLGNLLRAAGNDLMVTIYPGAQGGFNIVPPDTNYPIRDGLAMHPGGATVSTHPQYDPCEESGGLHYHVEEHL